MKGHLSKLVAVLVLAFLQAQDARAVPAVLYQMDQAPVTGANAIVDSATTNNANWGTLNSTNGLVLAPGLKSYTSNSWDFRAANNCYLKAGPNSTLAAVGDIATTTGLSFGFWCQGTNYGGFAQPIRLQGSNTVFYAQCLSGFYGLVFTLGDGSQVTLRSPMYDDNQVHHYLVTYDFRGRSNNLCLYHNGVVVDQQTAIPMNSFNAGNAVLNLASAGGYNYAKCLLDQVVLFTNALQAAEVAQLYNTGAITNYAPIVMAQASQKKIYWPTNSVNLTAAISDDGKPQPVVVSWTQSSGPGTVIFGNAATNTTTATFSTPGIYQLTCTANDGQYTEFDTVTVNVATNQPPSVAAWLNYSQNFSQTLTLLSTNPTSVLLGGWLTDEGLPNPPGVSTSLWLQASGPATVTFANPLALATTVTVPTNVGVYQIQLTASDSVLTNAATLTITVVSNLPPTVSAWTDQPILLWPSNMFSLQAAVSDDGLPNPPGALTYQWSKVTNTLSSAGTVSFGTPTASNTTATCTAPGIYQLRLVVSDGALATTNDVWVNIWTNRMGFTYKPPSGGLRRFSPNPPPCQHPRIFFTEADRPDLQLRATNDWLARQGFTNMTANVAATIDNPANACGQAFLQMVAGNTDYYTQNAVMNNHFYGNLAQACYLAWLWPTNPARLQQLATAVGTAATAQNQWWDSTTGPIDSLDLCYDFIYDWMSESQRAAARAMISQMYTNRTSFNNGSTNDIAWRSNWLTEGMQVPKAILSIEGETGFDVAATAQNLALLRGYCTRWGIMGEGFNSEAMGYFGFGMSYGSQGLMAFSRRNDNLFVTTRAYQVLLEGFYMMAPWAGGAVYDHQDESGWSGNFTPDFYFVMKYTFPNDPLVDWIFRNAYQGDSLAGMQLNQAIFGMAYSSTWTNSQTVADACNLPLAILDPQRGLGSARSDWSTNGLRLDFDSRPDTFYEGHMHWDRNNFDVWGKGRTWIADPGYHVVENDAHSTVLIDGIGQTNDMPGHIVDFTNTTTTALFAGDASLAYTYQSAQNPGGTSGSPLPLRWLDLWYNAPAISQLVPGDLLLTNFVYVPTTLAFPVQRAFRTTQLVRGTKSYVLVVDDIQKDSSPHTYEWSANTIGSGSTGDLMLAAGANATNAIFYHAPDSGSGKPRFLVRVINGNGTAAPINLVTNTSTMGNTVVRISIARSNIVAPDFKVLLFPHFDGDALPTTTYTNNVLNVTMSDGQVDHIYFAPNIDGRTRLTTYRIGGTNAVCAAPTGAVATAGDAKVTLTWNAVTGATGYNVRRATVSGGPYTLIVSNLAVTTCTNTSLVNGMAYFYTVSAINPNGDGEPSAEAVATPSASGHTPSSLIWHGDGTANIWNDSDPSNPAWLKSGTPAYFYNGDSVTFDDTGFAVPAILLASHLIPATNVVVNAAQDYTFAGPGGMTGTAGLIKNGSGTLSLLTSNDNSGMTVINGGWVHVGNGGTIGTLGSGNITLNGGGLIIDRGDNLSLVNTISGNGTLVKLGSGTLTFSASNSHTNTVIGGGTLAVASDASLGTSGCPLLLTNGGTLQASGTITLNNRAITIGSGGGGFNIGATAIINNTLSGTGIVALVTGTLQVGNGGATPTTVAGYALSSGTTLQFNSTLSQSVGSVDGAGATVKNNNISGAITLNQSSGAHAIGTITGVNGATILLDGDPDAVTTVASSFNPSGLIISFNGAIWYLNGDNTIFAGNLLINGGTLLFTNRNFYMNQNGQSFTMHGGTMICSNQYGFRMGSTFGANNNSGCNFSGTQDGGFLAVNRSSIELGSATTNMVATYALAGGSLGSASGINLNIGADVGGFGSATFTLSGTGKLAIGGTISGSQAGARQVLAFNGGTLASATLNVANLRDQLSGTPGSLVNNGGTLAPGDLGTPGKTTITGNYTVSNSAATLAIDIGGKTQANAFQNAMTNYDFISISGTAALGGSLNVNLINGFSPVATNSFTLLSASGGVGGSFTNLSGGRVTIANFPAASFQVLTTSTSVILTNYIQTGPSVSVSPSATNIFYGMGVQLVASAGGQSPLAYQWYNYLTNPITGATNASLLLTNLSVAASGNYTVVVTNPYGAATSFATILIQPTALTLTAGNDSKIYGQSKNYGPGSTNFSSNGLQNGETIGSVTLAAGGGDLAAASVGNYALVPGGAAGGTFDPANYLIIYQPGNLAVLPKPLTVAAVSTNKVYGTTLAFAGTEFTATGLVNGDFISSVSLVSTGATNTATVSGGPFPILISNAVGSGLTNYFINYSNGTLTVTKASPAFALWSSSPAALYGTAVFFTATNLPADATSNVVFMANGTAFNTNSVASGGAISPAVTNLSLGTNLVAALYTGDANYFPATNSFSQVITNPVLAAAFTASATNGAVPLLVTFTDISVGNITNRFWNFGDGFTTNTLATNVFHTFSLVGTNLVKLVVSDHFGTNAATLAIVVTVTSNQPPVIGDIQISGGQIIITGTNGTAGGNYFVLASTNLTLPATNWSVIATNKFSSGGSLNFTSPLDSNALQIFYKLRLP